MSPWLSNFPGRLNMGKASSVMSRKSGLLSVARPGLPSPLAGRATFWGPIWATVSWTPGRSFPRRTGCRKVAKFGPVLASRYLRSLAIEPVPAHEIPALFTKVLFISKGFTARNNRRIAPCDYLDAS